MMRRGLSWKSWAGCWARSRRMPGGPPGLPPPAAFGRWRAVAGGVGRGPRAKHHPHPPLLAAPPHSTSPASPSLLRFFLLVPAGPPNLVSPCVLPFFPPGAGAAPRRWLPWCASCRRWRTAWPRPCTDTWLARRQVGLAAGCLMWAGRRGGLVRRRGGLTGAVGRGACAALGRSCPAGAALAGQHFLTSSCTHTHVYAQHTPHRPHPATNASATPLPRSLQRCCPSSRAQCAWRSSGTWCGASCAPCRCAFWSG